MQNLSYQKKYEQNLVQKRGKESRFVSDIHVVIDSPAQGPGHAALVLRMVLLRRSLQRVHLRGVEAILELRRQRQVRYAILESGVLL